jgi:hypothetical protein
MSNSISNASAVFGGSRGKTEIKSLSELATDQTLHKLEIFRASYLLSPASDCVTRAEFGGGKTGTN